MTLKFSLLLVLSLGARMLPAQAGAQELDSARFGKQVMNQWWACQNQPAKECDMRLLVIQPEGLEMNCVNWSDGFSGIKSTYTLNLQDGFFELGMKEFPNKLNAKFIYGYLSENNLLLLPLGAPMALSPRLLSQPGWLKFERITR